MIEDSLLSFSERAILTLRGLFAGAGYRPFKMSKFEEYDLYSKNKEFLVSDGVIAFNDTNGKLMALKPDVTLSIIKNTQDGELQKVYYNENVYRISGETKQFKEIMQVGLECLGDIGAYEVYETVTLAALSLREISTSFVLDISHLGVLSAMLKIIDKGETFNGEVMRCLADKNAHGLRAVCRSYGVDDAQTRKLITVLQAYGDMEKVLSVLAPLCDDDGTKKAYDELSALVALLKNSPYYNRMRLDFSVVNDMNYYNGVVFKGFISGIPASVLSGGQYDNLMEKMGKKARAIGFAVYLDELERLFSASDYDVDVLICYGDRDINEINLAVKACIEKGQSVLALKEMPKALKYKQLIDLSGEGK